MSTDHWQLDIDQNVRYVIKCYETMAVLTFFIINVGQTCGRHCVDMWRKQKSIKV